MKNNKVINSFLIVLIVIACAVLVGVSYAAWTMNAKQTNTNVVSTGCFETSSDLGTSSENEAINLVDAMPISDSEAMSLTGFTFTITNVCKTYATYQVNLETLSTSTIDISYIKAVLNNNTPKKLNEYASVNKYLDTASSSNKLISGGLAQNESVTYTLRLWIGDDTEYTPAISNKTYNGKIVVKSLELVNELATDKIQNLVAGADTTSTDVIEADIENDGSCTNTLAYDGTADNNLRYVGANPCNYVSFNNETWRIIGVMNNIDDGVGNKETRIKLIRNESLGNYSWDTSTGSASATAEDPIVNNGYGINQWGPSTNYTTGAVYPGADLMQELNGDYLDITLTENTTWYNGSNNIKKATFDYTKRLKESSQNLIGNVVWYTGTYNDSLAGSSDITTPVTYQNERKNNPNATDNGKYCRSGSSYCNDTITRTYEWTGKVALMSISDFGYAVGGEIRNMCLTTNLNAYDTNNCNTNDWLHKEAYQWTLSPNASFDYANSVSQIRNTGILTNYDTYDNKTVNPSVYLKSNVKITGGDGTSTDPYTLGE